ncbi:MAG: hypothetical protein AAF665_00015 [Pseudomonadota bacterium]
MRGPVTATMLLAASAASAASATEPLALVTKLFDRYVEACTLAFTDPQALVNTVPPQNTIGQPNVHVTPDGKLVRVFQAQNGLAESIVFARHEGVLSAGCHIGPDSSDQSYLENLRSMAINNRMLEYTQSLADAVTTVIGVKPDIDFVGGLSPVRMAEDHKYGLVGGNPLQEAGEATHFFSFMLDTGQAKVPSLIAVHFGTAHIYTNHVIQVPQ